MAALRSGMGRKNRPVKVTLLFHGKRCDAGKPATKKNPYQGCTVTYTFLRSLWLLAPSGRHKKIQIKTSVARQRTSGNTQVIPRTMERRPDQIRKRHLPSQLCLSSILGRVNCIRFAAACAENCSIQTDKLGGRGGGDSTEPSAWSAGAAALY